MNEIINKWKNDKGSLSLEEKIKLLDMAKDAYYNTSAELLSDSEYDSLEKSIGYENKSYIGSKHNEAYTIKHPYIMGSLSKVQVHQGKDGSIDWDTYFSQLNSYISKNDSNPTVIVTPKYDGCSFEVLVNINTNSIISISGRGDGEYGKDISRQLSDKFPQSFIDEVCHVARTGWNTPEFLTLRGEVLVSKTTFKEKYGDTFANPRAFVAGMLNREDECIPEYDDLDVVIYDIRVEENGNWKDVDWIYFADANKTSFSTMFPSYYITTTIPYSSDLSSIYKEFDNFRQESVYAQDGIVFKPVEGIRINNTTERRPSDCVALKYTPMTEPTTVVDIEWKLGKTGEWIPTIVTETVKMDGKNINRASAFNYGYLIEKKISIGTKVVLSLAGDIIPFIYKVQDSVNYDQAKLGTNFPSTASITGIHLMEGKLPPEHSLLHSALRLNITGFGESNIKKFIEWKKKDCEGDDFFDIEEKPFPEHILLCSPIEIEKALGGKTGSSIAKAYEKILLNMSLKDIIVSCNFKLCGDKVAEQVAAMIIGLPFDFTSMADEGYRWASDENSPQWILLHKIFEYNGWDPNRWDISEEEILSVKKEAEKIPVILTGEPNDYASKAEFMKLHPEYRLTGSWKEVKIVFTNSLESNTGKMKRAKEKNIEIRLY